MIRWFMVVLVAVALVGCGKTESPEEKKSVPVVKPEAPPENPVGVAIPDGLVGTEAQCTCGSKVTVAADSPFTIYNDRYHFFCCGHCKSSFDKDPEGHLKVRNNGVDAPDPS